MAARRILAGLLVAALLPSSLAQGFALCNKDGKPAPPQNVRIARNEMIDDGKYGEVTVTFQQATANNNQLGCATMYRVELMENNNAIVKENIKADNPMQDMSFARKLNPGKTYKYKITAVNTNTNPARESDAVWTDQFTSGQGGNMGGSPGQNGWGRPAQCEKGKMPPMPKDFKVWSNGFENGKSKVVVEWSNPTNAGTGCTTHYKVSWDGNSEFVKLDNPNQERVRWEKALEPRQYAFYVVGADLDHQKFSLPHIQRLNAQQSGVQPL